MLLEFDFERMEELLKSFFNITGVRYSLLDRDGSIMCASGERSPFCERMNALAEGHARCAQCDADAIRRTAASREDCLVYTCHAGLTEAVIPVRQHGEVLAYIIFGQMAPQGDGAARWEEVRERIAWMEGAEALQAPFLQLKRAEENMIQGCAKVLKACSAYIWMEGVLRTGSMTDEQLLTGYIDAHYTEKLTLGGIARALSMSKTKLCAVAARQGSTVMTMVNQRRMEEAKRLLRGSSGRISEIGYLVGIGDYNYFTKLFKANTGETPREYQKRRLKRRPQK